MIITLHHKFLLHNNSPLSFQERLENNIQKRVESVEVWSNKFSSEHRLKVANSRQLFLTLLCALCSSIVCFLQTVTSCVLSRV